MKAAVVTEWGRVPEYTDFADPQPRDDAAVATVEASALTNLTKGMASGRHYASGEVTLPAIPGADGVARLDDGTRIYTGALAPYGMMAERTLVNPQGGIVLPEDVDSVTAAAVPNPGMSAWMSLAHGAALQPGGHVLVLGATGVTGSMAVQLAKSLFGAGHVVVVGRNRERLEWLRTVGADDTIALGRDDLAGRVTALHGDRPFDAVLDYLWGPPAEEALAGLAASHAAGEYYSTRYVQTGTMAGPTITLPGAVLRGNGITVSGIGLGSVPAEVFARARTEMLPRLFAMVAAGELHLTTAARPLADVERVWTAAEPSGVRVVLTP
jgi:NADPH:quinone reductase-like Zn-dependent oxidoreductase